MKRLCKRLLVVAVADNEFVSDPNLQYVLLQKSVTKIGNNAFRNCAKLMYVGINVVCCK